MNRAFVASSTLKPMAKQLLENRTPQAYAGVEAYAQKHSATDEGAMANLVLGYARILDNDYVRALPHLKKAALRAGDLGDYVSYYTAVALSGSGDRDGAIKQLADFQTKYGNSILARDAGVMYANALFATDNAQAAISTALKYRNPPRSDLEFNLGRAYMKMGDSQKAIEALRRVYYSMPLASEASQAGADLSSLGGLTAGYSERKIRADVLAQGRRYRDAAAEYRDLVNTAPTAAQRDSLMVAAGIADYRSGEVKDAKQALAALQVSGDANAQKLWFLIGLARDADDEGQFNDLINQLRQAAPTSGYFEQSLLSAGNMYLLKKNYDRAIDFYREIDQRFPKGRWGHYAHWKAAWLDFRQGRTDAATEAFESQIARYPDSAEVPAAMYWRGRMAEEKKDPALARAFYKKITERYPNYYYADRARDRMQLLGTGTVAHDPLLDHVPPLKAVPGEFEEAPEDDLRVQKARLLENCGLFDFAVKEIQRASAGDSTDWRAGEIARLYQESGGYHRALNYMKRAVPSYFALDYSALPRNYWETLFPRPFWSDLKRYSEANELDPYLVASLIRQESEFNPGAISRANALGLMQVLPDTGRQLAKETKLRGFQPALLLTPHTNMQLGTRYFKHLLEKFNGTPEYALAAYNAGSTRVESWLADGTYRDPQEFVESIPFTETREYVQAIMRNASVYKKLYSKEIASNQ
ncbi:MAG TPA: transglycosylase SLT domain-containing protein [Terriglobales bacterium]|nr:transglycosylase SLT domain-containing protein [Terriglobales bacterium]